MTKPGSGARAPTGGAAPYDGAHGARTHAAPVDTPAAAPDGASQAHPAQASAVAQNADHENPAGANGGDSPGANGDAERHFTKRPSKRGRRRRRRGNGQHAKAPARSTIDGTDPQTPMRGERPGGPGRDGATAAKPATGADPNAQRPAAPAVANRHNGATAYAALDLGTNNCRLLVAVPTRPGAFRVIDAFSRIVRLGEGLDATGRLSDAAMDRAVGALKVCRDKLTARPIERTRLIATEACRSADNGAAFLERVQAETGLSLEVVDRATEARLAVAGCGSLIDRAAQSTVLFDIGGGSSEIAVIDLGQARSRRLADHISAWTSLPVGVVTMAERFGGGRHVDEASFAAMTAHAEELLSDFAARERLSQDADTAFHLIGTSGTVTTLAGIHLGLERYDRRRVDGLWMRSQEVDAINDRLLSWSFEERVANPCIGRDRADLVLAGCAILQAIRNVWPAERLRVADRGLREGLLTEMMSADGVWRRSRYRRGRGRPRQGGAP